MAAKNKRGLTNKQEAFARAFIETGNASEAYRRAYNVRPGTLPNSIHRRGCHMMKNSKIAARVEELQEKAAEKTIVTVESITRELDENRRVALTLEQAAAMNAATMGKAKLHGLLVDKTQGDVTIHISGRDVDL